MLAYWVMFWLGLSSFAIAGPLLDPSMEGAADQKTKLPAGWDAVVIGNPAEVVVDTSVHHEGKQSVRINAPEIARSYVRSEAIPVAPGEKVRASAWVKYKDVPVDKGTVIMIAEWTGVDGRGSEVAKFDVAKRAGTDSDWQLVDGAVTVPAGAANMRLRMGFSYSQGTCWWDDVKVELPAGAVRVDLLSPTVTAAMDGLPVTVLNREGKKGRGELDVQVGKQHAKVRVELDGQGVQHVLAPLPLGEQTGKVDIVAALSGAGLAKGLESKVEGVVPRQLILPPVSPTHWCVEDGDAHLDGVIELSVSKHDASGGKMDMVLTDSANHVVVTRHVSGVVTGVATPYSITAPGLKLGEYKLTVTFAGGAKKYAVSQPYVVIPRKLAKVTINENGYPVYDGRVIFPMGIFNGGRFKEQGDAGFTVSHAYNAVRVVPGRDPEDQKAKEFLDQSAANHQMAVCMVPLRFAEEGDWESFRKRIRLFRNHPGLLAWDEEEGLARGDWKMETLVEVRKILQEEDPNHPFMVGDSRDVITRMGDRSNFFPEQLMDMGMWWWYPFPLLKRGESALEGEEASPDTTLAPPTFLLKRNTQKPVWVGIQAYKKPGPGMRFPTPVEYRLQAYDGIVEGAQGLMWYGGGVTGGMHTDLKASHWDYLQELVKELSGLTPALVTPIAGNVTIVAEGKNALKGVVKKTDGMTVGIVVNCAPTKVSAMLSSPLLTGKATVVGEKRDVTFGGKGVKEVFEPYGVHVYVVGK